MTPFLTIPLSGKRGAGKSVLVSREDAHLAGKKWHLGTDGYARRKATKSEMAGGSPANISLHREILGLHLFKGGPGLPDVDHINGDRLDDRRENLRKLTRAENNMNRHAVYGRSSFVGVSFFKPAKLWRAYAAYQGRRVELGYFKTELAAAEARDAFCGHHLPTARLNLGERNG